MSDDDDGHVQRFVLMMVQQSLKKCPKGIIKYSRICHSAAHMRYLHCYFNNYAILFIYRCVVYIFPMADFCPLLHSLETLTLSFCTTTV